MTSSHWSRSSDILSIKVIRAIRLDLPFWNPNWYSYTKSWSPMYMMNWIYMRLSKIVDITGNTETGLQLENIISSTDLNIWTTFAIFNSFRNTPATKKILHLCANGLFVQFCTNFIMRGRRSSHTAALSLKLHIILHISSPVIAMTHSEIFPLWYTRSVIC